MEVSEELMLKWCNHRPTLVSEVAQLRHQGWYADVTLACEGRLFLAHKFVLAMCSDYFRNIFSSSGVNGSNSTLVIVLKDVACQDVEQLLDYMYTGIVAVDQACLTSLIKTAENLQIKGLALPDQLTPGQSVSGGQDLEHRQQHLHEVQQTASDDGLSSGERDQNYEDNKELCNIRTDAIGPDVRLSGEFGTNRPLVSTKVGISPPSKRKRLHDYRQEYSPVSSANQQQVYSPQKVTTSPALQHLFAPPSILASSALSSPANLVSCSSSVEPASMGVVTHQQPSTHITMQSSKGINRVPADQQSVLEQQSTVHQNTSQVDSQSQAGNSLNLSSQGRSFASSAVSNDASSTADGGSFSKCKTLPVAPSHGPQDASYSQPEKVEIKQEAPDSEDVSGSSVSSSGTRHALPLLSPSKEQPPTECKEEPLHEDGEEGPSGVNTGEECWGTSTSSTLLAETPTDEDANSDSEAPGVWPSTGDSPVKAFVVVSPQSQEDRRRKPPPPPQHKWRHEGRSHRQNARPSSDTQKKKVFGFSHKEEEEEVMEDTEDDDVVEITQAIHVRNRTGNCKSEDIQEVPMDNYTDISVFEDPGIAGFFEGFESESGYNPSSTALGLAAAEGPSLEEYNLNPALGEGSFSGSPAGSLSTSDNTRYSCRFCGRSFDRMSNLKRHFLLHTGSKPFQCLYCEYRATQKVNVVQHMANKHRDQVNALLASQVNINDMITPKE